MTSRFLIADEPGSLWGHIFEGTREVMTRFVFDIEANKMLAAQVKWNANGGWENASVDDLADIEDSLVNANEAAIADPDSYGLLTGDTAPDWVDLPATPAP